MLFDNKLNTHLHQKDNERNNEPGRTKVINSNPCLTVPAINDTCDSLIHSLLAPITQQTESHTHTQSIINYPLTEKDHRRNWDEAYTQKNVGNKKNTKKVFTNKKQLHKFAKNNINKKIVIFGQKIQ